jgi:prepilin-type N-terminal cleavage/methylation domain-containing protein
LKKTTSFMFLKKYQGFTLIELLTVMAVIAILAGLILSISGYAQKKAATSKAETEIQGLSTALESYKADNGIYPRNTDTDSLDPRASGDPTASAYSKASKYLYGQLSGDSTYSTNRQPTAGAKSYFEFKPAQLLPTGGTGSVTAIADPFGYSYGYSTYYQADLDKAPNDTPTHGYNPTFDLWCTVGKKTNPPNSGTDTITPQWIKNW